MNFLFNLSRKDEDEEEDRKVAEANDFAIDVAASADSCGIANATYDSSMRHVMSVEEAENLKDEADHRRWPWRN